MNSLSELIFNKAKAFSNLEALKVLDRRISYDELNSKALTVAAALIESGASKETVGIVGQRKAASYFGLLGILYAGCSYSPISLKNTESRISSILKDSKIRFLVGDKEDLEKIEHILLANENLPSIQMIIQPEGKAPSGKKWRDQYSLEQTGQLKSPVMSEGKELAYLLYTSGSTGVPKGVQVTNSNVLSYLSALSGIWQLEPNFRASQTHDFSFDPSVSDMFFTWSNGGALCILPEEELLMPFDFINREKLDIWSSVPTVASFMMKMGLLKPNSFPTLRKSRFAGEPFPKVLADAWQIAAPNSTVENHYGPTETTVDVSRHLYTRDQKVKQFANGIIPIGKPLSGNTIAIIDELHNRMVSGEIGEIVFKGPQVSNGYLNDQRKTESVFVKFEWDQSQDTWYRSGDLGFFNEEGILECLGRKDNQIKLGGKRVEIGEIESALSRFDLIKDVVVVPLKDESNIVIGCVAFTISKLEKMDEERLRKESSQFLEKIFFPKRIIRIESFPLTISGKTDRKTLAQMAKEMMSAKR